jgi:hypothetical protein
MINMRNKYIIAIDALNNTLCLGNADFPLAFWHKTGRGSAKNMQVNVESEDGTSATELISYFE